MILRIIAMLGVVCASQVLGGVEEDYAAVRNEVKVVEKEYRELRYGDSFDPKGEYKKVDDEYMKVARAILQLRKTHPEMKAFNAEESRLLEKMTSTSRGTEEFNNVKSEYASHREALEVKSNEIQEMKGLKDERARLSIEMREVEKRLIEANPKISEVSTKLKELKAKRRALSKEVKALGK